MSILLEALRKSERREHLGQVPTIHQPDDTLDPERRALSRPVVILLLVVVAIMLSFMFWRQYAPVPVTQEQAGAAQPASPESAVMAEAAAEAEAPSSSPVSAAQPEPEAAAKPEGRTPMERLMESSTLAAALKAQSEESSAAPPARNRQDAPPSLETPTTETLSRPPVATVTVPAGTPEAQTPERDSRQPHQSAPISFWQLPAEIRSQLPPMKITVLVWAERPDDRFVLMDARRRVEGDEIAPGLVLEEVQRDGVLLSYRAYRFLVHH